MTVTQDHIDKIKDGLHIECFDSYKIYLLNKFTAPHILT